MLYPPFFTIMNNMNEMNDININLLSPRRSETGKRKMWHYIFFCLPIILILGLAVVSSAMIFGQDSPTAAGTAKPGFFTQLKNLILSPDRRLKGEETDRVNILLLGIGGEGHDGAFLTDTIMLASVKPSTSQVALLSIPRDLIVPIPGYGFRKINNADAFGELKQKGNGSQFAKEIVENVLNLPIHYYIRVDFEGFKQMIDTVGGVKIYVDRTFEDVKFPTSNYKYRAISFSEGWRKMDGQTALDYARSRHGNNNEGNDFARSRRQQKVLVALKDKVFSFSTFLNPGRLQSLFENLRDHIQANLELWEINQFYKLAKKLDYENMISRVLTADENGPLVESQFEGASILQPRTGDFEEIQRIARDLFITRPTAVSLPASSSAKPSPAKIEIQNGTWTLGLAAQTKAALEEKGFIIQTVGNANVRNHPKTVIYDYSAGRFATLINRLSDELRAEVILSPPADLTENALPDILIILGKDYATN